MIRCWMLMFRCAERCAERCACKRCVTDWLSSLCNPTQFNLELFIRRSLKNSWHQQEASEGKDSCLSVCLSVCLYVCESWNSTNSVVYRDSFSTSQTTQSVSVTKTNPLMLFRKVIAVCRENNRTVHINTNSAHKHGDTWTQTVTHKHKQWHINTKIQKRLMLKQMVHIVTAQHQRCGLYRCPFPGG
jgi:hypothetical protein